MIKYLTKFLKFTGIAAVAGFSIGCAGPASPFGATEIREARESQAVYKKTWLSTALNLWNSPDVTITMSPEAQVFHKSEDVSLRISDSRGFTKDSKFYVFYNGRDVTKHFQRASLSQNEMAFSFPALRLNPRRIHHIDVAYQREANTPFVTKSLETPVCDSFAQEKLESLEEFTVSEKILNELNEAAQTSHLNPRLLAALVAQESSFNPEAVSFTKAIGLTQVTHIAEDELLQATDEFTNWPRHPGIRDLNYMQLRYKIMTGKINARTEWRLRSDLSLRGGALFYNRLKKYWDRPDKKELIEKAKADINQVLLASYNIGAAAVYNALSRKGSDWLSDKSGQRALKYVQMVGSYCREFNKRDIHEL